FHGYPYLIHRLAYRRNGHKQMHVRGYTEKGNINTPLELAINNRIDRFSLVLDVLQYVPSLPNADEVKRDVHNKQQAALDHAYRYGIDVPELENWIWSYSKTA
ncbi:MAG TPA: phosphoketolase, partial [Methylotenera sp.]|nr:phosphoketolase [Methylotenera sp.]